MKNTKNITHAALIGAMYFALTHLQNLLVPNSATWAIQFRASEALCVLALFTPAAVPGLTIGCLLFNLSYAGALPLDWLAGSFATFNALFVGWELTIYLGDTGFTMAAFWLNALNVAIGELAVLYTLGWLLQRTLTRTGMARWIFEA